MSNQKSDLPLDADSALYKMPEVARGVCQDAVNAGLARSPEEFWSTVGDRFRRFRHSERALEHILRALIAAHVDRHDSRSPQLRLRTSMDAILGAKPDRSINEKDDDDILAELAWIANDPDFPERDFRSATRAIIRRRGHNNGSEESDLRRIVGKFKLDRDRADDLAKDGYEFDEMLEWTVIREVLNLLASIGIDSKTPLSM